MSILLPLEPLKAAYRVTIERENGLTFDAVSVAHEAGAAVLDVLRRYYEQEPSATTEKLWVYVQPVNDDAL